jgi:hypothetical protein
MEIPTFFNNIRLFYIILTFTLTPSPYLKKGVRDIRYSNVTYKECCRPDNNIQREKFREDYVFLIFCKPQHETKNENLFLARMTYLPTIYRTQR